VIDSGRKLGPHLPDVTGMSLEDVAKLDAGLLSAAIPELLDNGDPSTPSCSSVAARLWQNYLPEPQG
jgi:hypothetical protein